MTNDQKVRTVSSIIKPGILFLLIISGITAFVLAGGWAKDPKILLYTLIFGAMAGGSANILNNFVDRDIDRLMGRTRSRPIPSGRLDPGLAMAAGISVGAFAVVLFWIFVNPIAAVFALCGIIFYVVVYTIYLKPRTTQNIVLGGIAGMFPPIVGWSAIGDPLASTPILLGIIIVLWTPPHFWSLAIVYKQDYSNADVPMLPSVKGELNTRRQIMIYSTALVIVTIIPALIGNMGLIYLFSALALGISFIALSLLLLKNGKEKNARLLFQYSIIYLTLLFLAMILDVLFVF